MSYRGSNLKLFQTCKHLHSLVIAQNGSRKHDVKTFLVLICRTVFGSPKSQGVKKRKDESCDGV